MIIACKLRETHPLIVCMDILKLILKHDELNTMLRDAADTLIARARSPPCVQMHRRIADASSNINDVTIMARAIVMPPIIEQFEWPRYSLRRKIRARLPDAGNNATGRALNATLRSIASARFVV